MAGEALVEAQRKELPRVAVIDARVDLMPPPADARYTAADRERDTALRMARLLENPNVGSSGLSRMRAQQS
jgi:hypothetical protein